MMVSFSPMPFASGADYVKLWTQPTLWPTARSRINAIHVYYDNFQTLDQGGATEVGYRLQDYIANNAFALMAGWGLDWEIEIWPLVLTAYRGHPVLPDQIQSTLQALDNVTAAGGSVKYLRVEWGWFYGFTGNGGYIGNDLYTIAEMADDFKVLVDAIHAQYPLVQFGDQEPLNRTYFEGIAVPAMWDQWLTALAARGVQLAFMDADTLDYPPGAYPLFAADMVAAKAICENHGVIFGAEVGPENYPYTNDQEYFTGTMALVQSFKNAIGAPERIQFRAWDGAHPGIPLNVPETAPYSHTHLINVALDLLEGTTPPVANFTASQVPATLTVQFLDTSA